MQLTDALADRNIRLRSLQPGEHRTTCPACSHTRKKKSDPCLAVKIDDEGGAAWNCHHCGDAGNVPAERLHEGECKPSRARAGYRRPPADHSGTKNEKLYAWFAKRGISAKTVDAHGITVAARTFPPRTARRRPSRSRTTVAPIW